MQLTYMSFLNSVSTCLVFGLHAVVTNVTAKKATSIHSTTVPGTSTDSRWKKSTASFKLVTKIQGV